MPAVNKSLPYPMLSDTVSSHVKFHERRMKALLVPVTAALRNWPLTAVRDDLGNRTASAAISILSSYLANLARLLDTQGEDKGSRRAHANALRAMHDLLSREHNRGLWLAYDAEQNPRRKQVLRADYQQAEDAMRAAQKGISVRAYKAQAKAAFLQVQADHMEKMQQRENAALAEQEALAQATAKAAAKSAKAAATRAANKVAKAVATM
jgi:hypothetical protein